MTRQPVPILGAASIRQVRERASVDQGLCPLVPEQPEVLFGRSADMSQTAGTVDAIEIGRLAGQRSSR